MESSTASRTLEGDDHIEAVKKEIGEQVLLKEYEILIACQWNLNKPCGSDILELLLELQDDPRDSKQLLETVNNLALL